MRLSAQIKQSRIPRANTLRPFTSTASQPPSRRRRIHQAATHRAPSVETQRNTPPNVPPYVQSTSRTTQTQPDAFPRPVLSPNNLFHPFTTSPAPEIRKRASIIRQNAYCPHPSHQPTRNPQHPDDPEGVKVGTAPPAHVRYECPDCGIPVSCCEEHFADDYESHLQICDVLRQINEDDHDLVSGRSFPEFEYPTSQIEEAQVNMMNWDTFMFSREFNAINDERSMRQATRLLTYPITVGSVLHELSPYSLKERLTPEGLRSMAGRLCTIPSNSTTPANECF